MTLALILLTGLATLMGAGATLTTIIVRRAEAAHPAAGRFVSVSGARLHALERAPPTGQAVGTVVLLHGASSNAADMMLTLGALLAKRYRVIAFDRPGHGWSDRPGGRADASPARQASLLREALDAMDVDQAVIVGHSWSGALSTALALEHADIVRGLVVLAGVTHPWPGGVSWYYDLAANPWLGPAFTQIISAPVGTAMLPGAVEAVFAPERAPSDYANRTGARLVLRPDGFRANGEDVAGLLAFVTAQARHYGEIRVPTTIMHGDRDRTVSLDIHARALARQVPGAKLIVMEGVGHMPQHTQAERVAAEIDTLMRASALPASGP